MQPGTSTESPAALIRTRTGHITFWSAEMEARFGFRAEAALGRKSHELLRVTHWQARDEIEAILEERSEWNGGLILHRADGHPVMVSSYWYLHRPSGSLVTELHTDFVGPGTTAANELADVMTTIAQEISQPLTAIGGFITGAQRAMNPGWPDRQVVDRRLAEAAAAVGRAGDILSHVRALGKSLRDPRLLALHAMLAATLTHTERVTRKAEKLQQQSVSVRQERLAARERRLTGQQADAASAERALILQNIQVFQRSLATHQSDEDLARLFGRLLVEEKEKLAFLDQRRNAKD